MIDVSYSQIKSFISARSLSAQYIELENEYRIVAIDGPFSLGCVLNKDGSMADDVTDFLTNIAPSANQSPLTQVLTQKEKNDKVLKLAKMSGAVADDGTVTMSIKLPSGGRYLSSGEGFFDVSTVGDEITSVRVVDTDNVLGYGGGAVIADIGDIDLDAVNQGWYIPAGGMSFKSTGVDMFIPEGLYFEIKAKKGGGITAGTCYVNLFWSKKS